MRDICNFVCVYYVCTYVYIQDLGNLNVTLFAHRSDYDRPRNLRLVTSALNERWNTQLSVNQHNDIICRHRWKVRAYGNDGKGESVRVEPI